MDTPWRTTGVSIIGARHVRNGQPCQDSVRFEADDEMVVVAVADGHGDPRHARSQEGSQIAVEVACQLLRALGEELVDDPRPPMQVERQVREHLSRRMAWEWNRRVKELAGVGHDGTWDPVTELFGTTLLGVLVTQELVVFFQLGDGDILFLTSDGAELITVPDTELWGNLTHSLCQQDASSWVQVNVRSLQDPEQTPRMVVLSTDGVRDCMGDGYKDLADWLTRLIQEKGWEQMVDEQPEWIAELSKRGNGDDATLALVDFDEHWGYHDDEDWEE